MASAFFIEAFYFCLFIDGILCNLPLFSSAPSRVYIYGTVFSLSWYTFTLCIERCQSYQGNFVPETRFHSFLKANLLCHWLYLTYLCYFVSPPPFCMTLRYGTSYAYAWPLHPIKAFVKGLLLLFKILGTCFAVILAVLQIECCP